MPFQGIQTFEQHAFLNIAGAATTVVKAAPGWLRRVVINKGVAAATIAIYNNASAASGTLVATITTAAATPVELPYEVFCSLGITIVTSGASDVTVVFD